MFVRVKSSPNSPRKSVQLVESVRNGDKVRQKIARYIGVAFDEQKLFALKELAKVIKCEIEAEHQPSLFPPEELAAQAIRLRTHILQIEDYRCGHTAEKKVWAASIITRGYSAPIF